METIHFLQSFRSPFFDLLFKCITFLGDEYFYILSLTFIFWYWKREKALLLGFSVLIILYFNAILKAFFAIPRPEGVALIMTEYYSFPSGHAMGSFAFFITLALFVRKKVFWVFALIVIFLIGLSRVYLGAHYPKDILAGWAFGAVFLFLLNFVKNPGMRIIKTYPYIKTGGIIALIFAVLFLINPDPLSRQSLTILGAMAGLISGASIEMRTIKYVPPGSTGKKILHGFTGFAIVVILYVLFSFLLPELAVIRLLKYFIIALFISCGAPYIFQRMEGKKVYI